MKTKTASLLTATMASTAFSLGACATKPAVRDLAKAGRIIEFKSGPEGFDTRTFFYEGEHEVVAFDSQFTPELARASLKHLRTWTEKPVTWLVITHPNPDKFNGTSVFKAEGAKIIASEATADGIPGTHAYKKHFFVNMAKMFTEQNYPQPVPVDEVFTDKMTLILKGGEKIELAELNRPGISTNQTVAWIPAAGALVVGDLIHHNAHAWLEGGISRGQPKPELGGWMAVLKQLAATYPANAEVLGGRGETVALAEGVKAQIAYLKKAEDLVRAELKSVGGDAGKVNYKALAARFEQAFPGHGLGYMIEYGAYGLVNQIAAAGGGRGL
jgi:glyoxylase-like metal-dependent hydrolase (beta-lactamase superfamily II)